MKFSHLHCHSQFSLLDGAASIEGMMKKAQADNMPAVAITDHGNMFGVFQFVNEANKYNIKPIVGCEFYVVADRHKKQFTKGEKDARYHQLMLAKNAEGYKNLSILCSLGFIEGKYSMYPRIDKELILKYNKGLIATTCCLGASVPRVILNKGEEEGEIEFKWWLDIFGEDYYVELQRHGIPEQQKVNEVLLKFAKKYNVKIIASNDSHYINEQDSNAHDILLCINTNSKMSDPTSKEESEDGSKGKRFAFFNNQFFFKSTEQMTKLFHDLPQAIDNTNEIVDKVDVLKLKRDILLPNFPIPDEFKIHPEDTLNQWEYLKHITFIGAKNRYLEITPDIEERLNFELFTVKTMGFAGYFLIVSDFIKAGRDMGVFVGPGRGSAAGSAVAYCIGITNIDPIKYNLLFERFLNPDRKSMPDIDTDFDDEGRQKVIDYVVEKYGKRQVAQIVTYGTMAAKTSIKDVARVMELPLDQSNGLAKLVPERPGISLNRLIKAPLDGDKSLKDKEGLGSEELEKVKELRAIYANKADARAAILEEAMVLEGSVRGTGVHAAGIIIAPSDLTELVPVATAKDSELLLTQYEGKVIEDAGVIKMDFLGLKTLTIIKNALKLIKKNHGIEMDIDEVDLTDQKTFEIFQKGATDGIFQFESAGMQKHMKDLKPDKFDDIIAMNALYRPGPIEYIPNFIRRKHGLEPVTYDLADMEEYLKDTYGITVYQEQVMLLSQKLAGFSKGDADVLRKAMGKKDKKTLDKLKPQFLEGASAKGHDAKILEKVWTDWEAFASYAFNKSHSTCYAFVAFQTAWLKAHYPAEYMAANLTNEKNNIEKLTYFLDESKRIGVKVLGPDVNESSEDFDVNKHGEIRFGLGAIKGTGEAAIASTIEERNANGPFKSIFDFAERNNLRTVNKKSFEALANAGAFDCFPELHRAQYFADREGQTFLERLLRYGNSVQESNLSTEITLFGGMADAPAISRPAILDSPPWDDLVRLRIEKDVIGLYISGHPLDQYKMELDRYTSCGLDKVMEQKNKDIKIAGIVTNVNIRNTKNGDKYANLTIEDFNGTFEMTLWSKDYVKFASYCDIGAFLYIQGKVQSRYGRPDEFEFKPSSFGLLSEVRNSMCKGIKIELGIDKLNSQLMDNLEKVFSKNSGKHELKFLVKELNENISFEMFSRKFKIDPNNEFLKDLDKMNLTYTLL
ncbi:MAG: DNA polymerase III subunit alpha [Opitutaceae bacterium]|nr:DNA polymerase III subunit alpha [Cytophagales bacterium]